MPRRSKPKPAPPLTPREEKFVEVVTDPAKTGITLKDAAIEAGYKGKRLNEAGHEVSRRPRVAAAIEQRKAELARMANVDAAAVLGATARIAFASVEDALDDRGDFDYKKAKQTGAVELIKKISRRPGKFGTAVSVEFYPKDAALARLGNYLGLETEARPNPKKAAMQLLETIRRVENLSLRDAIQRLLRMQNEKQVTLVPPDLLIELARDNGIVEISVE